MPAHSLTPRMANRKIKTTPANGDRVCVAVQKARQVLRTEIESRVFAKDKAPRGIQIQNDSFLSNGMLYSGMTLPQIPGMHTESGAARGGRREEGGGGSVMNPQMKRGGSARAKLWRRGCQWRWRCGIQYGPHASRVVAWAAIATATMQQHCNKGFLNGFAFVTTHKRFYPLHFPRVVSSLLITYCTRDENRECFFHY